MCLEKFLVSLFQDGRVEVPRQINFEGSTSIVEVILAEAELLARDDFPGEPPTFSLEAAIWASRSLMIAAGWLVWRDLGEAELHDQLSRMSPPENLSDSSIYSVDLVFRYLPDIVHKIRQASPMDPLLNTTLDWCLQWLLSSVGVSGLSNFEDDVLLSHPGLARYYIDRILTRGDWTRLRNPQVGQVIQATLGAYDELAPEAIRQLARFNEAGTQA